MDSMDSICIIMPHLSYLHIFYAFLMQKWLKIGCLNLKSRYFKTFFSSLILKLVSGKWPNQSKIRHDWSLDIVLQNWHVNFWNFDFSRFYWAVRLLSRQKTSFFPISAAVKSAKIEISKFHVSIFCVYLQGSCMLIFGSIGPFSRD